MRTSLHTLDHSAEYQASELPRARCNACLRKAGTLVETGPRFIQQGTPWRTGRSQCATSSRHLAEARTTVSHPRGVPRTLAGNLVRCSHGFASVAVADHIRYNIPRHPVLAGVSGIHNFTGLFRFRPHRTIAHCMQRLIGWPLKKPVKQTNGTSIKRLASNVIDGFRNFFGAAEPVALAA